MTTHQLTLSDLMAAVVAAALGFAAIAWAMPGRPLAALIVLGPSAGALIHRAFGGRGVLGGALGGAAYFAFVVVMLLTGPHGTGWPALTQMADWKRQIVVSGAICITAGAVVGAAAWLLGLLLRRTPPRARLRVTIPSTSGPDRREPGVSPCEGRRTEGSTLTHRGAE